ncbi:MAG: DUF4258 domain-containing protein [Elainellaceae cyanobacterium]
MRFYISRHAEEELDRRAIPRDFLDSVLSRRAELFVGWVSVSVTHAGVGFRSSTATYVCSHLIVFTYLRNPQQIVEDRDGKKVYQSQFMFKNDKTYLVRAVIADNTKPAIVITVYRTS